MKKLFIVLALMTVCASAEAKTKHAKLHKKPLPAKPLICHGRHAAPHRK